MRGARATIVVAVVLGGLVSGASALGASGRPAGGHIDVFLQSEGAAGGKILITGAIGDSGTTTSIDKNGTVDPAGDYAKVTLTKGTLMVNKTALEKAVNSLSPNVNKATCSAGFSLTVSISLFDGTGLYKGISGTLKDVEFLGFISPRYTSGKNKGQCDLDVAPTAQLGLVVATGTVSFS
jgi:hypothetical protein